ncbi:hypothetical protein BJ875DRAFT_412000, partial [Amylocarpus encephaloides]
IQQHFVSGTSKALERSTTGQIFFGGTAEAVDHHLSTALDKAPPDLLPYLRAFCTQVADLSLAFHRAYTSGETPQLPSAPETLPTTCRGGPTSSTTPSPPLDPVGKFSYAQTAKSALTPENTATATVTVTPPPPLHPSLGISKPKKTKSFLAKPDLRDFIRLPLDSLKRKHSAQAIFLALCDSKIGGKELVQEVLSVNSGFTIISKSKEALDTLLSIKRASI